MFDLRKKRRYWRYLKGEPIEKMMRTQPADKGIVAEISKDLVIAFQAVNLSSIGSLEKFATKLCTRSICHFCYATAFSETEYKENW